MIPKISHSIWIGSAEMPPQLREYRDRLIELHSEWKHCLWTERNLSALRLQPHQYEHSTFAGSSNVIRLHALARYGGVYLDSDVEVLKPLDHLLENSAFAARQADGPLCNAVIGAEPNHPWINQMIAEYGDQRIQDAAYGCHIMDAKLDGHDVTVLPPETFYPWNFSEESDRSRITAKTLAVHHWSGSWVESA